jgi:adenylate cyclase
VVVRPEGPNRRLAAILSADVVGYSRLMAEDEAATVRTLTAYRKEIQGLVADHRGRVVDATGDNLLAEFSTAFDAVECAVEIQRVLGARNAGLPEDHRMEFRIGVHLGDVTVEDDRLYGDGVNIAARLEGLAESGGICISAEVHGQVERKLDLGFEDLGEQKVKNIPRSVHVYRVYLKSEPITAALDLPGMEERTVPGFHGAPAIAVLPFDNLSGDPDQEHFADGLVEDLIMRLSAWHHFPVLARNSAFVYKGRSVDVQQVGRDLGVRYLVEGSVRRARDRVRIAAQLIDATTAHHVWAGRYDRKVEDVFEVQDDVSAAIASAMHPGLEEFERHRSARGAPGDLGAWEVAQRGWWHANRLTREDNREARTLLERAIRLDPHLGLAYYYLAALETDGLLLGWTDSVERSLETLRGAAETAVALDAESPYAHLAVVFLCFVTGERERSLEEAELAVALNPSLAVAHYVLGAMRAVTGDPETGIASLETAMRLSPSDPWMFDFMHCMGIGSFALGRYEEAARWCRRSLQRRPDYVGARVGLAASLVELGRLDEARAVTAEIARAHPEISLQQLALDMAVFEPDLAQRVLAALRRAGLRE